MIVARADASQRTRPTLECRTSRAIASPRGRPSLRRRVLSTTVEARHIGGERVEDDHVDRFAAAVAPPASSSALEAVANGATPVAFQQKTTRVPKSPCAARLEWLLDGFLISANDRQGSGGY